MTQEPLTNEQLDDALKQLHTHCQLEMEKPIRDQEFLSVRASLYTLGFHGEDAQQVMDAIYAHGFTYCFDSEYGTKPNEMACYWMPDQLKSRLPFSFWKHTLTA